MNENEIQPSEPIGIVKEEAEEKSNDAQEASEQYENEARYKIEQDTTSSICETKENEEKVEEEVIVNDDVQTDKSESPLVKEVCEATGSHKAESELNENETVSKEGNEENEKDVKMLEEIEGGGDDVISSQNASTEDIREPTIGQHATTVVKEILKEEEEDKTIDAQEVSEQYEEIKPRVETDEKEQVKITTNEEDVIEDQGKEQEHIISEEHQGKDDVTCLQDATSIEGKEPEFFKPRESIEDVTEEIKSSDETKDDIKIDDGDSELNENEIVSKEENQEKEQELKTSEKVQGGQEDKKEKKPEESDNKIVQPCSEIQQEEDTEEIKPSVETLQQELLHDVTTDDCITSQTESQVESEVKSGEDVKDEEKEQEVYDVTSSQDAKCEDVKESTVGQHITTEPKEEAMENEEKIEEEVKVNDDGQTEKFESPLVKEVCEVTGLEKEEDTEETKPSVEKVQQVCEEAGSEKIDYKEEVKDSDSSNTETIVKEVCEETGESEEGLKLSDNLNIGLNENEITSKVEDEEKEETEDKSSDAQEVKSVEDLPEMKYECEGNEPKFVNPRETIEENTEEIKSSGETKDDIKIDEDARVDDDDDGESELNEKEIVSKDENQEKEQEVKILEEVQGGGIDVQEDKKEQKPEESDNKIVQSCSAIEQEEDTEEIKPSVETESQVESAERDVKSDEPIESDDGQNETVDSEEVKETINEKETVNKVEDEEKEQEGYDVTSSQDAKCEDVNESTVGQHVTEVTYLEEEQALYSTPKEILKEEAEDISTDAQEASGQYEEIKPSVETDEKEQVKITDNEEDVSKDQEKEQEPIISEEDQGKDDVTHLQDATSIEDLPETKYDCEDKAPEFVKPREYIEEDTEEIKSSAETKDDIKIDKEAIVNDDGESELNENERVRKEENQEKEQEVKILEEVQDDGIDAQEDKKEQEPEETESKIIQSFLEIEKEEDTEEIKPSVETESQVESAQHEVKSGEPIQIDDGQKENVDSEKVKETTNEKEIVSKVEDEEKEQEGYDVTSSQDAKCEDVNESTVGQHVTEVTYLEEEQDLSSTPKEIFKEEAEDISSDSQEASGQYEEIKPSVETDEKEQVKITGNEEDVIKDQEKEQDPIISEEDQGKDDVTHLQDATSIEDLPETKYDCEDKAPEFVKPREYIEEDTEEIKSCVETKDDIKIDKEAIVNDDGESESNENEIMSKEENQENEQEVKLLEEVQGGGIDAQEDKKEQESETESKIVQSFSEIKQEENTEEIKPSVETESQVESAQHEVKSGEPNQSDDGQKENVDNSEVKETTNEKEIVNKVEDEEKEQEVYDVTSSQDATCEDVKESTVGQHVTTEPKEETMETEEKIEEEVIVNKEENQEKEKDLKMSEEVQGGGDDVTSSQDAKCEDIKETTIGQHVTTDEIEQQEYTEEIKPSVETDEKEQHEVCEEVDLKNVVSEEEIKLPDSSDMYLNEKQKEILSKDEYQEKEQGEDAVAVAASEEDLKVNEHEFDENRESMKEEDNEVIRADVEIEEKVEQKETTETEEKIEKEPKVNDDGQTGDLNIKEECLTTTMHLDEDKGTETKEISSEEKIEIGENNSLYEKNVTQENQLNSTEECSEISKDVILTKEDAVAASEEDFKVNEHEFVETGESMKEEDNEVIRTNVETEKKVEQKETSETEEKNEEAIETSSEKVESEEGVKSIETIKDEDQEKDQVNMSEEGQGDDNVKTSQVAALEDDLQIKNYQEEEGKEPEFVETRESIEEDTKEIKSSVKTMENEEKIEEEDIVKDDGQTDNSESSLVKEVCEVVGLKKDESELNDDEIVCKEEIQEKEKDLKMSEDVTSSQIASSEDIKETLTGQHATTVAYIEPVSEATHVDEEKGTETKPISSEEKTEIGENNSLYEKDVREENQLNSTEKCSEISKEVPLETQKENETNDLKEQIFEEDSQKISYSDPSDIDESPKQALESVCDVQTPEVVADSEDSKLKEENLELHEELKPTSELVIEEDQLMETKPQPEQSNIMENIISTSNEKELTDEVSSELGGQTVDEITNKDENLSHESIEDPNDSTTKEEKCFQDGRTKETEPVKELNDGLDEASKEKTTDLNETTEVEPQEDIVPSGSLVTSTEDTPNSENAKEESNILPKEDHESVHDVQIPAVGSKSEDSNMKEDCLTSTTEAYVEEEEEKETVTKEISSDEFSRTETTESKQVAEHSSISSLDSVLIEENRELHGEIKPTSELVIEEDEVMETKPEPVQSDIASENIAKHTSEKNLEDVTIALENQIDNTENQNETVKNVVLTDEVAVETEKEKENDEVEEPFSVEDICPTEIDQTLTSNQKELADEIEYSIPIPAGNNEEKEVKAENPTELENTQAAESPNLEFEKKEKDDELISEIQTPETTLKMKEELLEATNDTCETLMDESTKTTSESRDYADIHKLEEKPIKVSEIASEVAETVPEFSTVTENLPEKVHEASSMEKNEPETTTTIEQITPEVAVIDVQKHEKSLDYTTESITVDDVSTKEARLESINQENESEQKKEADENIERRIATEKELDAHVSTENLIEEREIDLTKDQRLDKEETGEKGVKTEEENEEDDEEEDNQMNGAPVMVEASKDIEVKAHKKSHNILSGVGSKVKHSIAKVKKAITGKSSSPKQSSPKESDQGRTNET